MTAAKSASCPDLLNSQNQELVRGVQELARFFSELNHPANPRLFIVGGMLRDSFLNKQALDIDVVVEGLSAQELREILTEHFPERVHSQGTPLSLVYFSFSDADRSVGCEIVANESRGGEIFSQRNFTCNAMAFDPLTSSLFDPYEGQTDLKNGILRAADSEVFNRDPINIFKGMQIAARGNLTIESSTIDLMSEATSRIDFRLLNKEVIRTQIAKLLLYAERPSIGFENLAAIGFTERFLPDLHRLKLTPQDPRHHPEGDVWNHTMMVLDEAARIISERRDVTDPLTVMLGALCHDLGKATHTQIRDDKISAHGHELAGVAPCKRLLGSLGFGRAAQQKVAPIVARHMDARPLVKSGPVDDSLDKKFVNKLRLLAKSLSPVSLVDFAYVCEADSRGRGVKDNPKEGFPIRDTFERWSRRYGIEELVSQRLLLQGDLSKLALPAGMELGPILRDVEEKRDFGTLHNKQDAISYVLLRYGLTRDERESFGLTRGAQFASERNRSLVSDCRSGKIQTRTELVRACEDLLTRS
ncbi:MAG: multifunctional tRNA nucleotidyl transferase / 23-cyclic phosphodiesterase / 2nucleotidase [Pseudomonadota bacterium]